MTREFEITIQGQTFTVNQEENAVQFYVNGMIKENLDFEDKRTAESSFDDFRQCLRHVNKALNTKQ